MPLTAAMVRLIDVADLIKARSTEDDDLRELCEDYRLARATLTKLRQSRPRRTAEIAEYRTLVAELEDEIIGRLMRTDDRPEQ